MKHKEYCSFCNLASGNKRFGDIDSPFMESDNYFAIASIGAFIEGWTLIVPKKHMLSCSSEYLKMEFLSFTLDVKRHIESIYGNVIMFEHGANVEGSLTGCGVDHAHFHIVPSEPLLYKDLNNSDLDWMNCTSSEIAKVNAEDYLFYAQSISEFSIEGLYTRPQKATSQFFRKILAKKNGVEAVSDYKTHLHLDTSLKSYSRLSI